MILQTERIFDTLVDTQKIFVSMKTKFYLRNYSNTKKESPLYLHITGRSKRERLSLDINLKAEKWNSVTQRMKPVTNNDRDINLILDNYESKITNIKTVYRLSEKILTPMLLAKELKDGLPRVNFVAFFKLQLEDEKNLLKAGTYRRYKSVQKKLSKYQEEIMFTEIDYRFFTDYRKYLAKLGNASTTINANMIAIKKYIKQALKYGIKIPIDLEDIKGGSTKGNRTSLFPNELKRVAKYYFSEFINPKHKLVLGYFLFGCMTGLRISDIQKLERFQLLDKQFSFTTQKSNKDQVISLNDKAREIINESTQLFVVKYTDQYLNRELKNIFIFLGIKKKISFHVSRHTFATNFLRMGGRVEKLQILLGHSDIKQTMIYTHIIADEANKEIFLLDNLF